MVTMLTVGAEEGARPEPDRVAGGRPSLRRHRVHPVPLPLSRPAAKPLSVGRLVYRFALSGVLILCLVALGTSLVSRRIATDQAISHARQVARLTGVGIVEPELQDGILDLDPIAQRAVDDVVRASVLRNSLTRVKIWRSDGTVLYSDEPRLIGSVFALSADSRRILRFGGVGGEVSELDEAENRFEVSDGKLLEVYLPLATPGGERVLYETYFSYDGVTESGRRWWLRFAVPTLGALILLELIQIPLAVSLARRLRSGQEERERLLRRAIDSSQSERRRIASDLHDGTVQDLTAVSFVLAAELRRPSGPAREVIATSAERVRDSIASLRSLLVDIYPPNLQEEGLESAVAALLAQLRNRGISTELDVELDVDLDVATSSLLYRAAQEALRNVLRHSGAGNVAVALRREGSSVRLTVDDDGQGVGSDDLAVSAVGGHVGLRLLAGLAEDSGGSLELFAAPGSGTSVVVCLPLP